MSDSFGERLRRLREGKGISRAELARRAGFKGDSAVRNLEQGKTEWPQLDTAVAIAAALGLELSVLAGDDVATPEGVIDPTLTRLIGRVEAGQGSLEEFPPGTTINILTWYAGCVAYQVKGDSMVDEGIRDGDFVIVRPSPVAQSGDVVVAWIKDVGAIIKKLDGKGYLNSRDQSRAKYKLKEDAGDRILGVLVGVVRRC